MSTLDYVLLGMLIISVIGNIVAIPIAIYCANGWRKAHELLAFQADNYLNVKRK